MSCGTWRGYLAVMAKAQGITLLPSQGVHTQNLSEDLKPGHPFSIWQQKSGCCSCNLNFPCALDVERWQRLWETYWM